MVYIWFARFASFFAEHLSEAIVALLVWKLTDSPLLAGLTIASGRIALWSFGLFAGNLVDRVDKEKVLIISSFVASFIFFLLAYIYFLDALNIYLLALLYYLAMGAKTFEYSAINTLVINIKNDESFKKNNYFIDNSKRWARMLSPLFFIIAFKPLGYTFLLVATGSIYLLTMCLYITAKYPEKYKYITEVVKQPTLIEKARSILKEGNVAINYIIFMLYNISYFSVFWVALSNMVSSNLEESSFGWVLLFFSIGGIIGNRLYKAVLTGFSNINNLRISFSMVAISAILLYFSTSIVSICAVVLIAGIGLPIMDMAMLGFIRKRINPDKHGMAFSIFRIFADFGLILGAAIGGFLLIYLEQKAIYVIGGLWIFVLIVATYIMAKTRRGVYENSMH